MRAAACQWTQSRGCQIGKHAAKTGSVRVAAASDHRPLAMLPSKSESVVRLQVRHTLRVTANCKGRAASRGCCASGHPYSESIIALAS